MLEESVTKALRAGFSSQRQISSRSEATAVAGRHKAPYSLNLDMLRSTFLIRVDIIHSVREFGVISFYGLGKHMTLYSLFWAICVQRVRLDHFPASVRTVGARENGFWPPK